MSDTSLLPYQLRPTSVSTAVLAVVCLIIIILIKRSERPKKLFWESLTTRDGRADERKITAFSFAAATLFWIIRSAIFGGGPTEGVLAVLCGFIAALLGLTTWSRTVLDKTDAAKQIAKTPQQTEILNGPDNPVSVVPVAPVEETSNAGYGMNQ